MKKALVIDDDEAVRILVCEALREKGFQTFAAENGQQGIELAKKELPDIILCDVRMAGVDGYSTLAVLRQDPATAAIPFILITGYADQAGMRQGMELGADDYLPKPFNLDTLYAAVESRLKKAALVREQAEKKLADLRDSISLMLPHELRTPLNGILAYGELMRTDAASLGAAEIAEMGQVISESAKRLQRLVENFLIYAQVELTARDANAARAFRAKPTPRPAVVIQRAAQNQAQQAGRPADLQLELADQPVAISEQFLEKIVDELVGNAFKFSKPGAPVKVGLTFSAGNASLVVADRGRGMTTSQIADIGAYMQFGRKVQEQQGQGLGLIICKRLAELHGGELSIQSEPNLGTTVTVRLPTA